MAILSKAVSKLWRSKDFEDPPEVIPKKTSIDEISDEELSEQDRLKAVSMAMFPNIFAGGESMQPQHDNILTPMETPYMTKALQDVDGKILTPSGEPVLDMGSGIKIPYEPFPRLNLYYMYKNSDAFRIPILKLNQEVHREGIRLEPTFALVCNNCGKSYTTDPYLKGEDSKESGKDATMSCEICPNEGKVYYDGDDVPKDKHKSGFMKPSWKQYKKAKLLLGKPVDQNNKLLKIEKFSRSLVNDSSIYDDVFIIVNYEYEHKGNEFKKKRITRMAKAPPYMSYLVCDRSGRVSYTDDGKRVYVCPLGSHREQTQLVPVDESVPICKEHNLKMKPVALMVGMVYGYGYGLIGHNMKRLYYTDEEVLHDGHQYHPSEIYGYSPAFTIYNILITLGYQDEYVLKYYNKMRPPRALLFIPSSSNDDVLSAFRKARNFAKTDPNNIFPMTVEPSIKGGRNQVQYINISGSLEELQFIEMNKLFRRRAAAIYGITALFSGDDADTAKVENPSQIVVHNRGIADIQRFINNLWVRILELHGITDWKFVVGAVEQADTTRDLQNKQMNVAIMTGMRGAGYESRMTADGEFVYTAIPTQEPMMGGAQNGMGNDQGKPAGSMPSKENLNNPSGGGKKARPSDRGGMGTGSDSSGKGSRVNK